MGEHTGEGLCICPMHEGGWADVDGRCPLFGHSDSVSRVEFSDDGAQVISACYDDNTVLVWDAASGRRVCQLTGSEFALVEGLSDKHNRGGHILTANGDTLLIYECGKEQQHAEAEEKEGAGAVACFKAPGDITSVRCRGAAICLGCKNGAVCILSAPFLAA